MREKVQLLRSCCYLVARWILVWDKEPVSVCTTYNPTLALAGSAREIHAPTNKPKESLAWKKMKIQEAGDGISDWISISTTVSWSAWTGTGEWCSRRCEWSTQTWKAG
jgi:hypothetical protein